MTKHLRLLTLFVLLWGLMGCAPRQPVVLNGTPVTRGDIKALADLTGEGETEGMPEGSVPLDRVLYSRGERIIASLEVTGADGETRTFDWPTVAGDARWLRDGTLWIGGETLTAVEVTTHASPELDGVTASQTDLAPTAAAALGLAAPRAATGHPLTTDRADAVLMIFLDGFGTLRLREAHEAGLIATLTALGTPALALAAYPPCTVVGSAAILTGAPPEVNGALARGTRTTPVETLFDVVMEAGLRGVAVEGDALAFSLRSAEIVLSGDRDGNGSTDDNVRANALAVLDAGMPDLLWVHFHGIDDAGHTYGPGSPEEEAAIAGVDTAVGEILARVPTGTLVLIFADHGMHAVDEEERSGNHGNLIERDMLVPIWTFRAGE